ncbi:SDR family NAD(P)-dependent oxidoreductase [Mesobacillus boroniphilus]|uniref:SDR family NAD(P)-dependent oxidoreductase n=1 Tax=Mesobacillus boroniphilus TaxID=308892 RepID=A0A944CJB7_9BACI|nr:SDR family oxidoreductase [Mesobacillus boroniphilus]MBS8264236.1 SDR family NAD(P)-dependent oxidoreductase [Mesobacillus boroniphilus]
MVKNKVVMITGVTQGLGKAMILRFAKEGAKLAVCARRAKELEKVKKEAESHGAEVLAVTADVSKPRDAEKFVALTIETFGRIDVLINNASILGPSPMPLLMDYPEEDFTEVIRVNSISPFLMARRVLPAMLIQGEGSVINVTSEAGHVGYAGWGAYGISKFAVEGLTQTWADELNGTSIRMNMVDPGEMDTEMHSLAVPDCNYKLARPDDVVDVFLFLASEESNGVNGQRFEAQEFKREEL